MSSSILKLLSFRVSGRFAHFRKFYTNASSLSYLVPPRTAITGMLASVIEYERDSYYEVFAPDTFRISVAVTTGTGIKKRIQSLNYLHFKYHHLLSSGTGKFEGMHTQCKLELLIPEKNAIDYTIYVGVVAEKGLDTLEVIENRLRDGNLGYGIYLGQRQFRGNLDYLKSYSKDSIQHEDTAHFTDTLWLQEKGKPDMSDDKNANTHMVVDQMPIHMEKEKSTGKKKAIKTAGRVVHTVKRVVVEKSGKRIFGRFKNGYSVDDKIITFFEG
jgi:CRISPR-associated protein Cas5h